VLNRHAGCNRCKEMRTYIAERQLLITCLRKRPSASLDYSVFEPEKCFEKRIHHA